MAIPPVIIQFQAKGVPDISAAMRSVADVVSRVERASTSATSVGSRQRSRIVDQEARNRAIAAKRGEAEFGAALKKSIRESEQAARSQAATAKREATASAAERMRIARQLASEEIRLRGEVARAYGRPMSATTGAKARLAIVQAAKSAPAHEQQAALRNVKHLKIADVGSQAEDRAVQREARAAARAETREARTAAKAKTKSDREHQRSIDTMRSTERRRMRQEQREAEQTSSRRRAQFATTVMGAGAQAGQTLYRGGVGLARTAMNMGGGFEVQDVLHDKLNLDRNAALLSNTTVQGEGTRISKDAILGTVRKSSIETSTDEDKLMSGLNAFTAKTGSYSEAKNSLSFYSKVAKTSGASVEDVMRTAGTMKVQNKNLSASELEQLTLSTVMQARKGSVEFEDMAQAGGKITRSAVGYTGKQGDIQSELLGLAQIGMRTEGNNVSAAATDISNVQGDALKHRDEVKSLLGRDFLDKTGRIEGGPSKFLADMLEASGGNLAKLGDAGIGKQAMKTFQALAPTFNEAQEKALKEGKTTKQANAAGKEAVLADIKNVSAGKYDKQDLEKDFATVMATSAEQFEGAVRLLKQEVADKLVPALIPLIDVIRQATPEVSRLLGSFTSMASWAAANPLSAAFAGLGVLMAKEVAAAGIAKSIEAALATKGGVTIGSAMLAITTARLVIEKMAEDDSSQVNRSVEGTLAGVNARSDLRAADDLAKTATTPEQTAAAESAREEADKKIAAAKTHIEKSIQERTADQGGNKYFRAAAHAGAGIADAATFGLAGAQKSVYEAQRAREATDKSAIADMKVELAKLTAVLAKSNELTAANTAATKASSPTPSPPVIGGGDAARAHPFNGPGRAPQKF